MSFRTLDHDVTCLCALVDLPKREIVEELPPAGGLARFQLQAFTEGAVGALLEWLGPMAPGAKVRRWQGEFAFGRIEVEEGEAVDFLRWQLGVLAVPHPEGLCVVAQLGQGPQDWGRRLGCLSKALG